jgi:hypothetical protein
MLALVKMAIEEGRGWSDSSGEVGIIRESKTICPVESDWSVG